MKIYFKKIGCSLLVLFAMLVFMPLTAHAYAFNKTVDMQKIAEGKYFFNGEDMADYSNSKSSNMSTRYQKSPHSSGD